MTRPWPGSRTGCKRWKYTEFTDRLTDNFEELQRVTAFAVEAVWKNNGYQKDPVSNTLEPSTYTTSPYC